MEPSSQSLSPHSSCNGTLAEASAPATEQPDPEPPVIVPPYWQRHRRGDSYLSIDSRRLSNLGIRLVDNTGDASESSKGLWARSAEVGEHVLVRGSAPGIGDYNVWICKVETLNVSLELFQRLYSVAGASVFEHVLT
jgi:hypothetical protein